jgi:hypothetical protein
MIEDWIETLTIIEGANLKRSHFTVGLVIAMLLSVKKNPDAINFWINYAEDSGIKEMSNVDGVYKLKMYIEKMKSQRKLSGHKNAIEIANTALACYEKWQAGEWFSKNSKIKQLECFAYRDEVCPDMLAKFDEFRAGNPALFEPKKRKSKKKNPSFFEEEQISLV